LFAHSAQDLGVELLVTQRREVRGMTQQRRLRGRASEQVFDGRGVLSHGAESAPAIAAAQPRIGRVTEANKTYTSHSARGGTSRRQFLAQLAAGVVGLVVGEDLERALWTPGARTHFLPSRTNPNNPSALTLPTAEQIRAMAAPMRGLFNPDPGLSIRYAKAYNVDTDGFVARMDVLYGFAVLRPELAVRIGS
jgi:hypothetical protein